MLAINGSLLLSFGFPHSVHVFMILQLRAEAADAAKAVEASLEQEKSQTQQLTAQLAEQQAAAADKEAELNKRLEGVQVRPQGFPWDYQGWKVTTVYAVLQLLVPCFQLYSGVRNRQG